MDLKVRNVYEAPVSTAVGIGAGIGQYLAVQGVTMPQDWVGWVQLIITILLSVLGALGKLPREGERR